MSRKCIGFILIREYPRSKKLGWIEPYTTGEFLKYPEIWKPIYDELPKTDEDNSKNVKTSLRKLSKHWRLVVKQNNWAVSQEFINEPTEEDVINFKMLHNINPYEIVVEMVWK